MAKSKIKIPKMKGKGKPKMKMPSMKGKGKKINIQLDTGIGYNWLTYLVGTVIVFGLAYFAYSWLNKNKTQDGFNSNNITSGSGNGLWSNIMATIYPTDSDHTSNWENPFSPPLKPNHYFMGTNKNLDIRDYNVGISDLHRISQRHNPDNIILKHNEGGGVRINERTNSRNQNYAQIGILTRQDGGETIIPLFGRPLNTNRNKWQYYTMNDKHNMVKLPLSVNGRSCTSEYGCNEVYNGDNVYVEGYNQIFNVTIYDSNTPEYIPF